MVKVIIISVIVIVLAIVGALFYLAFGDFPVVAVQVDKTLPDARFPK